MINFPLINKRKAWIWISYLSKNMKGHFGNFLISGKGIRKVFYFQGRYPNLFYFQERESLNSK